MSCATRSVTRSSRIPPSRPGPCGTTSKRTGAALPPARLVPARTGVGGAGVHWNGQTWRFHPLGLHDPFEPIARYGASAIPANSTIQDWGITYDELEPYYDKFEYMAGISGKAGNLKGKKIAGGNVFEGPRSREYPVPPHEDAEHGGLQQAAARSATMSSPVLRRISRSPTPIRTGSRAAHAPTVASVSASAVRRAQGQPNLTVMPVALQTGQLRVAHRRARVSRSSTTASKAHERAVLRREGQVQEQPRQYHHRDLLCLQQCAPAAALQDGQHPTTPSPARASVGKNYAYQNGGASASGYFKDRDFQPWMGAGALRCAIDDFNADNFDHTGLGFLGGGSVSSGSSGARPIQSLPAACHDGSLGRRVEGGDSQVQEQRDRRRDPGRCVRLSGTISSIWIQTTRTSLVCRCSASPSTGSPTSGQVRSPYVAPKLQGIDRGTERGLFAVGALPPHYDTVPYQSTHNTGGVIMGADPSTSVVNNYLQMWDFANVFVVGACNFPQNAGFNPTGTVGALAYRAAEGVSSSTSRREPV